MEEARRESESHPLWARQIVEARENYYGEPKIEDIPPRETQSDKPLQLIT